MKKAIELEFQKVVGLILILVFLAIILMYIFSEGGPRAMIDSVVNFLNSTTEATTGL